MSGSAKVTLRTVLEGAAKVARDQGAHLEGGMFSDGHRTTVPASTGLRVGSSVGEQNPYQRTAEHANRYALYPEPRRASGGRLCFDIMGLDARTYLRRFDRVDLCHPAWSIRAAREQAWQLTSAR